MGIDRIGKGPGATPPVAPTGASGPSRTDEAKRPFEVRPDSAAATEATEAARSTPLARLRAGEVDLNGYLDLKVEAATAHLSGLSSVELSALRKMMRDQLASDPTLADLVQRATGKAPPSSEE